MAPRRVRNMAYAALWLVAMLAMLALLLIVSACGSAEEIDRVECSPGPTPGGYTCIHTRPKAGDEAQASS